MKKLFSIVLAIAIIFAALPMAVQVSAYTDGNYQYNIINGNEAQLTAVSYSVSGEITVPSRLGGYKVTSIGINVFQARSNITKIVLPDTITTIGDRAFNGCRNLVSIEMPDNLVTLGSTTFLGCTALTSVTFGDKLTTVGNDTFVECTSLTEITLPDSITDIGANTFYGCTSLTKVNYPNTMTVLSSGTFQDCTALKEFTVPDSIEVIEDYAFYGCTALKKINFSTNTKKIYDKAFYYCTSLKDVTIPDSVSVIGKDTFRNCSALTDVTLGSGVASVDEYAFYGCSALSKIHLKSFGDWCEIDFASGYALPAYDNSDVKLYVNGAVVGNTIPEGTAKIGNYALFGSDFTSLNIPSSVKSIGSYAFASCENLSTVTGGSGLNTIDVYAFSDCTELETVTFSEGVVSIGDRAFDSCSSLVSVTLPNSAETIGEYAFRNCSNLQSLTLGENIKSIGEAVFYDVNDLETVTVPSLKSWLNIDFHDVISNPLNCGADLYFGEEKATSIVIPEETEVINNYAFYGCKTIEFIRFTDSVSIIGTDAIQYCSGLKEVILGNGISAIDDRMFYGCEALTKIHIPKTVQSVGDYAFYHCSNLETVTYSGSEIEAENLKLLTEDTHNDYLLNANWEYNVCYHSYSSREDYSCNNCYESLTPPAPAVDKVKYNSVTLKFIDGLEYSIDGINWQDSNIFTDLEQETSYTFYQRVKETSASKQSEISVGVAVTTPVKPPYTPYDCNDDGKINTSDLAAIKLFLAAGNTVGDGADCNEDGEINTSDLAALKLFLAGN